MTRRLARSSRPREDSYSALRDAVALGVAEGWKRAHAKAKAPDEGTIRDAVEEGVVSRLCELVDFGPDPEEDYA